MHSPPNKIIHPTSLNSYDVLVALSRIFRVSTDYLLGSSKQEADAISSESISVDLSGLSDDEIFAIKQLVRVMREQKKTHKGVRTTLVMRPSRSSYFQRQKEPRSFNSCGSFSYISVLILSGEVFLSNG